MRLDELYSDIAIEFMKANGMHQDDIDLEKSLAVYLDEMKKGLCGEAMLPMAPTYVHGDINAVDGSALAIDIGGTNLRFAIVKVDENGEVRVSDIIKAPLPGKDESIDSESFFAMLANHMVPFLKSTDIISCSFAQEIKHFPDLDGRVVALSKEFCVKGLVGKLFGESLKEVLAKIGFAGKRIIVLNDTVGVAGCMAHKSDLYDSFIGLVMGTGTNTCYIEDSNNIRKINNSDTQNMFINVESAEFIPVNRGKFDRELDLMTEIPGDAPMEKMTSGRYVGNLFWLTLQYAVDEGYLSEQLKEKLFKRGMMDTIAMSDFLADPYGDGEYVMMCDTLADREFLYTVGQTLVKRGAKLIALEIAGAAIKTGRGTVKEKPVCVVAEGTTYYTLKGLKEEVEGLLGTWLQGEKGVYVNVNKVDNAAIKGIGIIGLSYL